MEYFSELDWVRAVTNVEVSWHEADDPVVSGWLGIETLEVMSHLVEAAIFCKNVGHSHALLSLEGKDWLIGVEILESL